MKGVNIRPTAPDLQLRAHGWLLSAGSSVLLDQASEDMMTLDLADRKRDDAGLIEGCAKVQGPVRPAAVVMADVLGQDYPQVPLAEDQHPIGAFGACRAYPPLGKGVRARCPRRDLGHLGVVAREHVVEDPCELEVPIADKEPERGRPIPQVSEEVTGLLGDPGAIRAGSDTEHVHEPCADLHDEEDVQPAQCDCVDGEEVTRQRARSMCTNEVMSPIVGPAGAGPSPVRFRMRRIVEPLTWCPSRFSSPRIRSYPHDELSLANRSISATISGAAGGRPQPRLG